MIIPRLIIPLEVIESWPSSNHIDPITRGSVNLIVNIVFFSLVIVVVALRIYTRLCISKSFGLDDWLIVLAVFPTTAFAAITLIIEFRLHWDRHIWDVDFSTLAVGLKLVIATFDLFDAGTTLTKLSMLTLSYRIIGDGSKALRKIIIGAITLVAVESILFVLLITFQCSPMSLWWTLSVTHQNCISETKFLLAAGIINTITDFFVVIIPLPIVLGLKLPFHEQLVLLVLFGAGFIICAAGCVRTFFTYQVTVSHDQTWMTFPVWISSDIELYLGIICASIPATKKFFSRYCSRLIGPSTQSISDQTKTTNMIPNKVSDAELHVVHTNSSRWTHEGKHQPALGVQGISIPNSHLSGFIFTEQVRKATPRSSTDDENEIHVISRMQSYEELVASANQSRRSYGAFG